jgi:DNA-binding CsgD family transcriptional regulator
VRAARAEAAWLAGDRLRAASEARAAFDLAAGRGHRRYLGELAYWRWRAGDLAAADVPANIAEPFARQIGGDWAGAAAAWDGFSCPYEAARARADGNDEHALLQALVTLDRLGARPLAASVRRRLRAMGAHSVPRGPRPSTRSNPAHLTRREAEVAALLAEGQTNRQIASRLFLSPRTVERHVASIFATFHVATRVEAATAVAELGVTLQTE